MSSVNRATGINRSTLRDWRDAPADWASRLERRLSCPRCAAPPTRPEPRDSYGYLLGLYLGDGCLSRAGPRGVWILRIACDDHWPGLQDRCAEAMSAVMPGSRVGSVAAPGCHQITSYSKHWPASSRSTALA